MFVALTVILPIFALIFAGYGSRKIGVLGKNASSELNRFVVYLALPALLFSLMSKVSWRELYQPGFVAAFGLGCGFIFALTLFLQVRNKRHLADASIDGLNAAYPNTGFIGFPLGLVALGPESQTPVTIASIITVCVLFAMAIILIEIGLQAERNIGHALKKVSLSLVKNPLLFSPVLGVLVSAIGLKIPTSVNTFLSLLSNAASPCALVSLGLFLAEKRANSDMKSTVKLVSLKLVVQPLITWFLAFHVFDMPSVWAKTAVLLTALPTGTGPFMLAELYKRDATTTSNAILFSTIISLITLTLYLFWIQT